MVDEDRVELADRGTICSAFAAKLLGSLTSPANPLTLEFDVTVEAPSVVEYDWKLKAADVVPPTPPPPAEEFGFKVYYDDLFGVGEFKQNLTA